MCAGRMKLPGLWTGERHLMHLPRGDAEGMLVGGIAAPQCLNERGRGLPPADHVLLPLLLLHLQREPRPEDALPQPHVSYGTSCALSSRQQDKLYVRNLVALVAVAPF